MLKYKLENKLEENNSTIYCEICGKESALQPSINEYHKEGFYQNALYLLKPYCRSLL